MSFPCFFADVCVCERVPWSRPLSIVASEFFFSKSTAHVLVRPSLTYNTYLQRLSTTPYSEGFCAPSEVDLCFDFQTMAGTEG